MDTPAARHFSMFVPLSCGLVARVPAVMPPAVVAGLEGLPGGDTDLAWLAVAKFALTARARGEALAERLHET